MAGTWKSALTHICPEPNMSRRRKTSTCCQWLSSLNAIIMQVGTSNISTGPQRKIPNFKRRLLRGSTKIIIIRMDARDRPLDLICTQHMGPATTISMSMYHRCLRVLQLSKLRPVSAFCGHFLDWTPMLSDIYI